jgi:4-amino-4-deoxy-L-arabinose transferase-like glycosyltransferase
MRHDTDPCRWSERAALAGIVLVAIGLRTLFLSQNDYGRMYYAAAVRGMLGSWHNLFFNAFDPGGFVSLDKPPVAIWLQAVSAKLLGFDGLAMLLPQVVEGVVAVVLVYVLVRRSFGALAGLLAALFLAVTPVSVAVDRSNNTDSCLVMMLLLALWAFTVALESKRIWPLLLAMAGIGVAFNVKMGAALVVVPAMAILYLLLAAPQPLLRRVAMLAAGGVVLASVSLSWAAIYDLVPAQSRPYVGSTAHNSMLELALVHNGAARFAAPAEAAQQAREDTPAPEARRPLYNDSPTGFLRWLRPQHAVQFAWLLPLTLTALVFGLRRQHEGRLPPLQQNALALWGGWLASYWLVLSYAGGPMHTYYLAALAPPVAALAAIAVAQLWTSARRLLLTVLAATVVWAGWIGVGFVDWQAWHWTATAFIAALAAAAVGCILMASPSQPLRTTALAAALTGLLALPCEWALSVVLVRPNIATPAADLAALRRPTNDAADAALRRQRAEGRRDRLLDFLAARQGGERFILAVPNALQAAPLIVASGKPVMAMGGYLGRDPILTAETLQRLVAEGQVRFILTGGPSLVAPDGRERALTQWIRAHGRAVDRTLWLPPRRGRAVPADPAFFAAEPAVLYDMRPGAG